MKTKIEEENEEDAEKFIDSVEKENKKETIETKPKQHIIKRIKKKGLEKITIGSDAHRVENLGEHLEKAVQKLKRVGYNKIVKFKNRKPEYIDL